MSTNPSSTRSVHGLLLRLTSHVWPELENRSLERQVIGIGEVLIAFYAIPLAAAGLIWLFFLTDINWIRQNSGMFLLIAALIVIFNQLGFFLIIELRRNRYGSADGSLTGIPLWSGVLLFGPTILWLPIIWTLYQFITNWSRTNSKTARWGQTRTLALNLTSDTLVPLLAFKVYTAIGGQYPFTDLNAANIILAAGLFITYFIFYTVLWIPYLGYHAWAQQLITGEKEIRPILTFFFLAIGLPQIANPFAILSAGLYAKNGLWVFLFFMAGMVVVAYLSRRLGWLAESSRQSFRLLEKLERLSRSIIDAPPDVENLPEILEEHITNMFPAGRLVVWIFPEDVMVKFPADWQPDLSKIWPWLLDQDQGVVFLAGDDLPWLENQSEHNPTIVAPIMEVESSQTFGGIYLELHTLAQPWNRQALKNLCPAIQALSAQIASAINQTKAYQQVLELNRVNEQLKLAGDIQASLLPYSFPAMSGWQLAVTLDPAGETSGDFFDIIPLEDGRIGFLIADVLDKGLGPALYMTLSRTLIRTYATEFNLQPDLVFFATNERILRDTRANLFVTVFFGIINLETGEMTYANAGHNSPYIISSQNDCEPIPLEKTGIPIGIDEETTWTSENIQMHPGDVLVLYTDGVPDAQNTSGEFYREASLVEVIRQNLGQTAEALQKSILESVYEFVGDAPPFDDITLMVILRDQ
jgi:serine phosphatase RsbU (regulator of sigma subunit)